MVKVGALDGVVLTADILAAATAQARAVVALVTGW
jgi:hypothetical protein